MFSQKKEEKKKTRYYVTRFDMPVNGSAHLLRGRVRQQTTKVFLPKLNNKIKENKRPNGFFL